MRIIFPEPHLSVVLDLKHYFFFEQWGFGDSVGDNLCFPLEFLPVLASVF